jgi:predicted RNA polymerase sigma factor
MGELSEHRQREFERFAAIWLAPLVAVLLRAVHDAALAYDLATEALAAARSRWDDQAAHRNESGDRSAWLIELGGSVLADAAEHKRVPSVERRRSGREPIPHTLTISEQHEMAQLAEARLELSPAAVEAAEALARTAPPRHILRETRLSGLVSAQPLPDHERERRES